MRDDSRRGDMPDRGRPPRPSSPRKGSAAPPQRRGSMPRRGVDGRAPSPPYKRGATSIVLRATKVVVAMASALVFAIVGLAWWQYRDVVSTSDALDGGDKSAGGEMNILLIGLDSRKDQNGNQLPPQILDKLHAGDGSEGGYNTNTLILVHIPAGGGPAKAFSIPRDDLVNIPGEHPDKIKKAYGYAKDKAETRLRSQIIDQHELETKSRDAGRRATLDVVRNLTGVPIDHFAEVNLAGFYDLATVLGGVDVCLNHPVQDDYSGANFPAGRQKLNASQALSFVRQRHGLTNGDLDRTRRQQAFLSSVATKLRSAGMFTDPAKLEGLVQAAKKDVVIDSGWDVFGFADQAQNLSGGNLQFETLPIEGFENHNGEDVNLIDPHQIRTLVRTAFGYQPAPTSHKHGQADVFNASGGSGLASRVSDVLTSQGFGKGQVANTVRRSHSVVTYHPGEQEEAKQAAAALGNIPTMPEASVPPGHLRVTLGADFRLPDPGTASPSGTTPQVAAVSPKPAAPPAPPGPPQPQDIPCVD